MSIHLTFNPATGRGFTAPLPGLSELAHLQRAVAFAGNVERLARLACLPPSSLGRMTKGERAIYAEAAVAIERATEGQVARWQLRPDLWEMPQSEDGGGVDVTHHLGVGAGLSGPDLAAYEEALFRNYQDAFHRNAADPRLSTAADVVRAWNRFADVVGVDRVPLPATPATTAMRIPKMTEAGLRNPGEPPVLDWLDKTLIDVDPAYQRELDEARVLRMLEWFEWKAFGAIVVAKAEDGRYHVTDGQHRLEAAKRHPAIDVVPAVIIEAEGTSGEAENFVAINKDRRNVTSLQLYWAELAAGDPEAQTVAQVCERAGVTIVRSPGGATRAKPGDTVSIAVIRSLVSRRGAMRARQMLEVLGKAELAPIGALPIRAVEILMSDAEFKDEIEPEALTESIGGKALTLEAEARAFAATHRLPVAKAMASVWFKRTRKRRRAA